VKWHSLRRDGRAKSLQAPCAEAVEIVLEGVAKVEDEVGVEVSVAVGRPVSVLYHPSLPPSPLSLLLSLSDAEDADADADAVR
jgi:hypothetical protein